MIKRVKAVRQKEENVMQCCMHSLRQENRYCYIILTPTAKLGANQTYDYSFR